METITVGEKRKKEKELLEKEKRKALMTAKKQDKENNKKLKLLKQKSNKVQIVSNVLISDNLKLPITKLSDNNKNIKVTKEKKKEVHVKDLFKNFDIDQEIEEQPNEDNIQNEFLNTKVVFGLCFTCCYNINSNNFGIKCNTCCRKYHLRSILKYKTNSDKVFTCNTCQSKTV